MELLQGQSGVFSRGSSGSGPAGVYGVICNQGVDKDIGAGWCE